MAPPELSIRGFLLDEVLRFVKRARTCPGVRRIGLIGSLTRNKDNPKDADVLVTVDDDADLSGNYLGRTCHWRECRFGIRVACDARHCGRHHYLHDDLDDMALDADLIKCPPLELWPQVIRRSKIPAAVEVRLIQPIEASQARDKTGGA